MKIVTIHKAGDVKELADSINKVDKHAEIHEFNELGAAVDYLKAEKVDAVFVDYHMDGKKMPEIFNELDATQKELNVIFIIGYYGSVTLGDLDNKVSGVINRPPMGNLVKRELDNLRYKVSQSLHPYFDPERPEHEVFKPF